MILTLLLLAGLALIGIGWHARGDFERNRELRERRTIGRAVLRQAAAVNGARILRPVSSHPMTRPNYEDYEH